METCEECGDEFTDSGPGAESLACPGTCVYCYENGDDDDESFDEEQARDNLDELHGRR